MTHLWEKNSHEPSGNKATHFSCSSLPREVEVHGCVAQIASPGLLVRRTLWVENGLLE